MEGVQILVLHRGWVIAGDVLRDGDLVRVRRGVQVRRWGTTRGLGEIAAGGPTKNTMLDDLGDVAVPFLGVIQAVRCDAAKWEAALPASG